jgi:hypothetical protein
METLDGSTLSGLSLKVEQLRAALPRIRTVSKRIELSRLELSAERRRRPKLLKIKGHNRKQRTEKKRF